MVQGDELAETAADAAVTGAARPLGPGDGIGRYRVLRVLGQGGMGVVYAAHDPDLDRPVALKVLRGAAGDEARTRLLREARAMAKLSHPNVITVYEVGSAGPIDFVAMELIDGKSLADWLAGGRRATVDVLRVFRAAARGLQAAHGVGLVHRDFKPANVLIGRGERVVVTDFGLARAFDDRVVPDAAALAAATSSQPIATVLVARSDAASLSSTLTRTGALLGTPAYMAPEQFAGLTAGPRSDQYAFCVALWEALAGARPFQGATVEDLRQAAQRGDALGADALPRWLRPILARGMAREVVDRYPDLGALMTAIDRAERKPRTLAIVATAGAALVAAIATVALWPGGPPAPAGAARPPPCPDADAELAGAWSPAQAGPLSTHLTSVPGAWRELGAGLDRAAAGWRDAYDETCRAPAGRERDGRLSCLALVRDQLAAAATFAARVAPEQLRPAGLLDEIDDPAGCNHPSALTRPALPSDPTVRSELSAIRVEVVTALMVDDKKAGQELTNRAIARAGKLPYPAALAEAMLVAGVAAMRADDFVRAEAMFDEAATTAEANAADGLRAAAMVGTARSTSQRSSDTSAVRAALTKARAAVTRAGDPAELIAHLELTTAALELASGNLDRSAAAAERARAGFDHAGVERTAISALRIEVTARNRRDRGDDVVRATELASDAIARATRIHGEDAKVTRDLRAMQGWILADHDPARAAAVFATLPTHDEAPPDATLLRGRVVGDDGRPRTGAVAYVGKALVALADGTVLTAAPGERERHGPRRAATDRDGRFTLQAAADEIVVVVAGELRSRPTRVRDLPASIVVRPTHRARLRSPIGGGAAGSITVVFAVADGVVDLGYQAITHRLDAQTWEVAALPDAPTLQTIIVRLGPTSAEYLNRRFTPTGPEPFELVVQPPPPGVALDVVVRGDRLVDIAGANVYVVAGKTLAGRSWRVAEFGRRAFKAPRMFSGYARPDDPSASAAAPDSQPNDLRVLIPDVPAGPVTMCVLPLGLDVRDPRLFETVADFDQLEVHCREVEVPAALAVHRVVLETPAMQRPPPRAPGTAPP